MQMIRRIAKIDTTNVMTVALAMYKDTLINYSEVEERQSESIFVLVEHPVGNTHHSFGHHQLAS